MAAAAPLSPEDLALLDRLAERVVELRLELPALLTLETATPLAVVAGQALVFFEPFVATLFRLSEYRRFARLAERREALVELARLVEARAERSAAERRSQRAEKRSARAPSDRRS